MHTFYHIGVASIIFMNKSLRALDDVSVSCWYFCHYAMPHGISHYCEILTSSQYMTISLSAYD